MLTFAPAAEDEDVIHVIRHEDGRDCIVAEIARFSAGYEWKFSLDDLSCMPLEQLRQVVVFMETLCDSGQ